MRDGWLLAVTGCALALASAAGCGGEVGHTSRTGTSDPSIPGDGIAPGGPFEPSPPVVDRADLLFMIDNSPSMQDKQVLLARVVPTLLNRFLNPPCVDVII